MIERQKIQGTCFKISALYFKIYGLYFLEHALCFFRQSENVVFLCDFRLNQYKNRLLCKEEKCRRLCADVKKFNNAGLLSVIRKSKIGTVNTFLPRTQAKSNMIETFLICNIAK